MPPNYSVYIDQKKLPSPIAGIRLKKGSKGTHDTLLIACTDAGSNAPSIKIEDPNGRQLARRSGQIISSLSSDIVSTFDGVNRSRFWKGVFEYLPKVFADLSPKVIHELAVQLVETKARALPLSKNLIYVRVPFTVASSKPILDAEISEIKPTGISAAGPAKVLLDAGWLHVILSVKEKSRLLGSVFLVVMGDRAYMPFVIDSVEVIGECEKAIDSITADYSGALDLVYRYILECLNLIGPPVPEDRMVGESVWRVLNIPNTPCVISEQEFLFEIDDVRSIPGLGSLVVGIYEDPNDIAEALIPEHGEPLPISRLSRFSKLDQSLQVSSLTKKDGFAAIFPGEVLWNTQRFELQLKNGNRVKLGGIKNHRGFAEQRDWLIDFPDWRTIGCENEPLPSAVAACHALAIGEVAKIRRVHGFSVYTSLPKWTVMIPLGRQIDHIHIQFSTFANDPDLEGAEFLLILEDPDIEDEVVCLLEKMLAVYRLRVRLLVLGGRVGWHTAINLGLSVIEPKQKAIVVLTPTVLPIRSGWLGRLSNAIDQDNDVVATVPKLVFEDSSIVYDGYTFEMTESSGKRIDSGYDLPVRRSFAAEGGFVSKHSLACAAIRVDRFEALNGFDQRFVSGEYSDSELCLRITRNGGKILYMPEAEMWCLQGDNKDNIGAKCTKDYDRYLHPAA